MNITIFTALAFATSTAWAQQPSTPSSTPVDLTAPSLKVHASLPQMNIPWVNKDLHEAIANAQSIADQRGITDQYGNPADAIVYPVIEMTRTFTPEELRPQYQQLACSADAIVTGHTSVWVHHLNSSGQGIYTDYDFAVDTVIKNNPKAPLSINQHIVLTRPGGSLQLGTGTIKTIDIRPGSFPHLETGSEYLIFLTFIPLSGGYEAVGEFGSFVASGGQWTIMWEAYSVLTLPEFSRDGFPPAISQWIASCAVAR